MTKQPTPAEVWNDLVLDYIIKNGPSSNRDMTEVLDPQVSGGYSAKVDGTLQRLRRAGRIRPLQGKWYFSAQVLCTRCKGTGMEPVK